MGVNPDWVNPARHVIASGCHWNGEDAKRYDDGWEDYRTPARCENISEIADEMFDALDEECTQCRAKVIIII